MWILQRLWLAPEEKQEKYIPKVPEQVTKFPQFHKQEITEDFEEKAEQERIFLEKMKKKEMIGKGNLKDMLDGYDRLRGKQWRVEKEVPYNNPLKHFRGNIDRIVAMTKEEVDMERGKKYMETVDDVLSRKTSNEKIS